VNPDVKACPVDGSPRGAAAHKPIEPQSEVLQELTRRIQAEYAEMPGLSVTLAQAQRLLASDQRTCAAAFTALISRGVLRDELHRVDTYGVIRNGSESGQLARSALETATVANLRSTPCSRTSGALRTKDRTASFCARASRC